jgi:transposase
VGQKGRGTYVWYERGVRPRAPVDQRFGFTYIFAAVRPGTDDAFALVLPEVNTAAMQVFLDRFAASLGVKVHVILLLDRAGWHVTKRLHIPPKLSLVFLPPYAPELNPVERVWLFLRDHFLSHRVFANLRAVVRGCCDAWQSLCAIPQRLASLTNFPYFRKVRN